MKKVISTILVAIMLLVSQVPLAAETYAANGDTVSRSDVSDSDAEIITPPAVGKIADGKCGDNIYWVLTDDGKLTISGSGKMPNMSYFPWKSYRSMITSVEINGVASISVFAFSSCSSIESVSIADSVTLIDMSAFSGCSSLRSITIPISVTFIGESVFSYCEALTTVFYPGSVVDWAQISVNKDNADLNERLVFGVDDIKEVSAGECGDSLKWILTDDGKLTIFGCGEMNNFSYAPWYSYADKITEVEIKGAVSVGENAFSKYYKSLEKVTLHNGVTTICSNAFSGCTFLHSVVIPDSVTAIEFEAFFGCTALKSISLPDSVTTIESGVFSGCTKLESVTIPESITSVPNSAFYNCTSLSSVNLPDTLTSIGEKAFFNCTSLSSIDLPESLSAIGRNAFYNCDSIKSVVVPGNVEKIGDGAFIYCDSIESVELRDGVVSIGEESFYDCSALSAVSFPDSLVSIGFCAFGTCSSLESVFIPGSVLLIDNRAFHSCESLSSVIMEEGPEVIGTAAFSNCSALKFVVIPSSVTEIGDNAFSYYTATSTDVTAIYLGSKSEWRSIKVGSSNTDLTQDIPGRLFFLDDPSVQLSGKCGNNLTWILYRNGDLIISGSGAMYDWSYDSRAPWDTYREYIKSIEISGATNIGEYAFYDCSVRMVTIPKSVTKIGYDAFWNNSGISEVFYDGSASDWSKITVERGNTYLSENLRIDGSRVFSGGECGENLTWTLDYDGTMTISGTGEMYEWTNPKAVPWFNYRSKIMNVEIIGAESVSPWTFIHCTNLTSVVLSDSVRSVGDWAFFRCTALEGITIPSSVRTIGDFAFFHCTSMTYVSMPESIARIGDWSFYHCTKLESIEIPQGIYKIGRRSFSDCEAMTSVTIPDCVTIVENGAFRENDALTDVCFKGTRAMWNRVAIEDNNDPLLSANIRFQPQATPGDTNGDGYVNAKDNAIITAAFGGRASDPESGYNAAADLNADGYVNAKDRAIVCANFGKRVTDE